jgi:hypothetical protein
MRTGVPKASAAATSALLRAQPGSQWPTMPVHAAAISATPATGLSQRLRLTESLPVSVDE